HVGGRTREWLVTELLRRLGEQGWSIGHVQRRVGIVAAARALERIAAGLLLPFQIAGLAGDAAEILEAIVVRLQLVVGYAPILDRHVVVRQLAVALNVVAAGEEVTRQETPGLPV